MSFYNKLVLVQIKNTVLSMKDSQQEQRTTKKIVIVIIIIIVRIITITIIIIMTSSESSKHHDVLGREYLGVSCRCLGEGGKLACLCLVSALVIQPVILRSVLRRFVHFTRSDNHLL